MVASDDGPDAWGAALRCPSNNAFAGDLTPGRLWSLPRTDLAEAVVIRLAVVTAEQVGREGCIASLPFSPTVT